MENGKWNIDDETWYLAQVNIARMLAPLDDPVMTDFVNNLDRINAVAEQSEGFVWRLVDDTNNATAIKIFDDDYLIVNMSVWKSIQDLFNFTYRSEHLEIFKRKKEWFSKMEDAHMALWHIPAEHIPTVKEAEERLIYLNEYGDTPYAFTFKTNFTIPEAMNYSKMENEEGKVDNG